MTQKLERPISNNQDMIESPGSNRQGASTRLLGGDCSSTRCVVFAHATSVYRRPGALPLRWLDGGQGEPGQPNSSGARTLESVDELDDAKNARKKGLEAPEFVAAKEVAHGHYEAGQDIVDPRVAYGASHHSLLQ